MRRRRCRIQALPLGHLVVAATLLSLLSKYADATTTYGCIDANFGDQSTCTAQDIKFKQVRSFQVNDSLADPPCNCNCNGDTGVDCSSWQHATIADVDCDGLATPISCWAPYGQGLMEEGTVFGACLGSDDNVNVALTVDLTVSTARYDVAMYINTDGGSARSGAECAIVPMVDGTYGTGNTAVIVSTSGAGTDGDQDGDGFVGDTCPDFTTKGELENFAFAAITLKCADTYSTTLGLGQSNGLLDFDVAISWQQNANENCDFDPNTAYNLPVPGSKPKCWSAEYQGSRIELPIYIPPFETPSLQPSVSFAPSIEPTISTQPSSIPSISTQPSGAPSTIPSAIPSSAPSISTQPSSVPSSTPSLSSSPSAEPSASPSLSVNPTSMPSQVPSLSSSPSSEPSLVPSVSAEPSTKPSSAPSISTQPSSVPSSTPSLSSSPSAEPSASPSLSVNPTSMPSQVPSLSSSPSSEPSLGPSVSTKPSSKPSSIPSVSAEPSLSSQPSSSTEEPSLSPSVSSAPSKSSQPTDIPSYQPSESTQPSFEPSMAPSVSAQPSDKPSLVPSVSTEPTLSAQPSSSTEEPSSSPSISSMPTSSPTLNPSVSFKPSSHPTDQPTDQPSFPPTGSPYYPDWIWENQFCVNDGATPEYMKELQRLNYLYQDKQECCEQHFSWRVRQCMGNDEPVYYRDGSSSTCKKGETRDDYDIAFDTLEECCEEQVWWDVYGCKQNSPMVLEFEYTVDFENFAEPTNCQDADAIAKRVQEAMAAGMPSGTSILVVGIGGITLENDVALGTTQCGGSLAGQGYQGDWALDTNYNPSTDTTTITFRVSTDCGSGCTDTQSVKTLYDATLHDLDTYAQGSMTQNIISAAGESPAIVQLQNADFAVDSSSFAYDGTYKDPRAEMEETVVEANLLSVEGELSISNFDTSSFGSTETDLAISFFQEAIETTLASQGIATPVIVTGVEDGKITYEIPITADSSSDAAAEASSIESSLSSSATRTSIASEAVTLASGSSIQTAFSGGLTVDSNTETSTTDIPVAKVVVEGTFATSAITSFTADDESFLEKAVYDVLLEQGAISEGAKVEVTNVIGGVITYEVTAYVDAAEDVKSDADRIVSKLSSSSTFSQIATQAASLPGSTLSGTPVFDIFASTHLTTSGVPSRGWWPEWGFSEQEQGCRNGGAVPAYMNRNYDQYFSNTKRKCCEQWFPYNLKVCVGPTIGGSRKEYFVPNWSDEVCTKKQEGAMESWEFTDTFDSLEDCCNKRFFYNYVECCSVPGLEGCSSLTELFYYPDDGKCKAGSAGEVQEWKRIFAESSMKACCEANFWWKTSCCRDSGGC